MPGATMSLDWSQLQKYLGGLQSKLDQIDYTGAFRDIGIYLAAKSKENFVGQHAPDGMPWKPFARRPSRRRGGASAKLLRDKGILMASLAGGGQGHFEQQSGKALIWGTSVDYGWFHQAGAPKANIPARPFLGITPQMEAQVGKILLYHAERQLGIRGAA